MKISSVLIATGFISVAVATIFFIATFYSVITVELDYQLAKSQMGLKVKREIIPKDREFGIVIPKISANAKIIPNVDPYNRQEYQVALTKGVAHAIRTSFPDEPGNVFLFSHSSVFYLIYKLEKGDEINIYFNKDKYKYLVSGKETVDADDVSYLNSSSPAKTLTLMTGWPPGTTWKRLLVIGELVQNDR